MSLPSLLRAILWLVIGLIAGYLFILLILTTSVIFSPGETSNNSGHSIGKEVIIFLCVALMAGAGSDYLLSYNFKWGEKGFVFMLAVCAGGLACFLFNPKAALNEEWLKIFNWIYYVAAAVYCVLVKTVIFEEERVAKKKSKYY